jgi:hypothetical protein
MSHVISALLTSTFIIQKVSRLASKALAVVTYSASLRIFACFANVDVRVETEPRHAAITNSCNIARFTESKGITCLALRCLVREGSKHACVTTVISGATIYTGFIKTRNADGTVETIVHWALLWRYGIVTNH